MGDEEPYEVRYWQPKDRFQIEHFSCALIGQSWTYEAEAVIRRAPEAIVDTKTDASIIVAADGDTIIGACVFGPESDSGHDVVVYSVGVTLNRQTEGIGTRLKQSVLASFTPRNPYQTVRSLVHRRNSKMMRVNEKLDVAHIKFPDDGEYFLTAIVVDGSAD